MFFNEGEKTSVTKCSAMATTCRSKRIRDDPDAVGAFAEWYDREVGDEDEDEED